VEHVENGPKGNYRTAKTQNATLRMFSQNNCKMEFDSPVTLIAGRKYQLKVMFMKVNQYK
jgi:hypothetical protein